MSGILFILSAPSGAGKTTLAKALAAAIPDSAVAVSHTTRAPRPDEEHGVHYYFVTPAEFEAMVDQDRFLEYAKVFDSYYGTSRDAVDQLLAAGKHVILDIDWQGARSIKAAVPGAKSIFILPPSREALEKRLRSRGQDSDKVIRQRMRAAVSEMRHYNEFDYVVVNDDFDAAAADLKAIIAGEPEKRRPLELDIDVLLRYPG